MRRSTLIAILIGIAFGTGQAMRSLPHGCDPAHSQMGEEPGSTDALHAHCMVCEFIAVPFDPAPSAAVAPIAARYVEIGTEPIKQGSFCGKSPRAARGPPGA